MNSSGYNEGGWEASEMRKFVTPVEGATNSGIIYNALPKKIRDNMTEIQNIRNDYEKLDYSMRYGKNNLVTNYKDFSTIECMLSQAAWMQ